MSDPKRRFAEHHEAKPEHVNGLPADHAALVEKRTLFPTTVVSVAESPRLLVSGANSRKIGDRVIKGEWSGMPIYTLTLEERATCPETCHHWATCYGNGMPLARRHQHGRELVAKLQRELAALNAQHAEGFVVRLHVLGDFYSVDYVNAWAKWLAQFTALRVFGYTAWQPDTAIGRAVAGLRDAQWSRFAVRTSSETPRATGATTIWRVPEEPRVVEGIVCPAQTDKTACCGSCGLCWSPAAREETIAFIAHGRTKGAPKQESPPAPLGDPGAKPQLGWLPVARLSVDQSYQRTLESRRSKGLIERLVANFNWAAFQAIVVTESERGWTVIDGQHRAEAARRRGETHVPAVVVAAPTAAEQAAIFVHANQDRVAVNPFALYHARLVAGDQAAKAVDEFCVAMGISIPRHTVLLRSLAPGQTLALKSIERIARDPKDRAGRDAVRLLLKCWPDEGGAISALLLKAVSSVLSEFPGEADQVRRFLSKQSPLIWAEEYSGRGAAEQLRDDLRTMIVSRPVIALDRARLMAGR